MMHVRSMVATATAVVAGLVTAPAAFAAPAPVNYVALGDSYSSGTGIGSYQAGSGDCRRSDQAYPELWRATHSVRSFTFAACSGADTNDVRNTQLDSVNAQTTLVSITIGGNDAGFSSVVRSCVFPASDSECDDAVNNGIDFVRNQLPSRLDGVYQAIKSKAPKAKVVVVGYPRLFELGFCPFSFNEHKRASMNTGANELDRVIANRAAAAGFAFADARPNFDGHGVCADEPWINHLNISDPAESYHPDATGHRYGYLPTLVSAIG